MTSAFTFSPFYSSSARKSLVFPRRCLPSANMESPKPQPRLSSRSSRSMSPAEAAVNYRAQVQILDAMMASGPTRMPLRSRSYSGGRGQSARGDAVVGWLLDHSIAADKEEATEIASALVRSAGLVPTHRVTSSSKAFMAISDRYYVHHALTVAHTAGLNLFLQGGFPIPEARPVFTVLQEMSALFAELLPLCVERKGLEVRYEKIRQTEAWTKILVLASELQFAKIDAVDNDVKKACLFNLYNIMIIHGKLVFGHPKDISARGRFFNNVAYVIAGERLNSTDLEHGVLRRKMADDHPLAGLRVAEKDARMHFILNCGAQSCPPLVAVDVNDTERVLVEQTKSFIQDNCNIDAIYHKADLSRLWKWFRKDFTPNSMDDVDLLRWIAVRAPANIKEVLDFILLDEKAQEMKVFFQKYNWADNGDWNAKPDTGLMSVYDYSFRKNA